MRLRRITAAFVICLGAWAQAGYSVDQIKSFVRSAIQLKNPDKEVALTLGKMKMSERLDLNTVETLQGEGAGPRTVEALKDLATASATLPVAKPPAPKAVYVPPPPPSSEEQAQLLEDVKKYGIHYSTTYLPDFICLEQTRRYVDTTGKDSWRPTDVITARLSYYNQKEDYKLVSLNDRVLNDSAAYTSVGGALSMGDFGTTMREIFEPRSNTHFDWERWTTLRKRRTHVFSYRVPLEYSQYSIHYGEDEKDKGQTIVVGYRGSIFVDDDLHMVVRIVVEAENIPPSFPVQQVKSTLDYEFTKIGDHEFLLPLVNDVRMHSGRQWTKNVKEFRLYRKFSADAVIKFDGEELGPLPDDKTKEQPPQPQPPQPQPPK